MRIEVVQPVPAPPEAVFAHLTDFASMEARARRRGLPVERRADDPPAWRIGVDWRGMALEVLLRVVTVNAPVGCALVAEARGVEGRAAFTVAPGAVGSVLAAEIDVQARGVAGRVLLQTLRVARPMIESRLRSALSRFAHEIAAAAGPSDTMGPDRRF